MHTTLLATALLPLCVPIPTALARRPAHDPPRLVVVLVFDQLRPDHLTRFQDLFLPPQEPGGVGGFRWLMESGAWFQNAHHAHVPTDTGPGHAAISTGADPSVHGIIGNTWYDRATRRHVFCVEDPSVRDVLTGGPGRSPRLLLAATLAEEMQRTTLGASRVVSLSFHDFSSILMAGRASGDVLWFSRGRWTTSTWYAPGGRLPQWVEDFNNLALPWRDLGRTWGRSLPPSVHRRVCAPRNPLVNADFGEEFPHTLPPVETANYWRGWLMTPFANDFLFAAARAAVAAHALGSGPAPDLLLLSVSPHDYLGHAFGPDSPQVMELTVAADRQLAEFFRYLDGAVPGGLDRVLVALTSDHGVQAIPEEAARNNQPGGRANPARLQWAAATELFRSYGTFHLLAGAASWMVWLDQDALRARNLDPQAVERTVAGALLPLPEVHSVFARSALMGAESQGGWLEDLVRRSLHPGRSGDVWFFLQPGWLLGWTDRGTTHGTPWPHDTAVPLLFQGGWVERGLHLEPSHPKDLPATLAAALGIAPPAASSGRALRPHNAVQPMGLRR